MRKPRRMTREELAPFVLELPGAHPHQGPPRDDTPDQPTQLIDWRQQFGSDHPVEVEVGFGKGLFLLNAGLSRPDRNFFGIEWVRKYQLYAASRIAIRNPTNVKTCCADAKIVLGDLIPAASVEDVHVYFPDPWWKKRHKKRLLFTPDFADSIVRILKPGGRLHFVSDVADYFAMVVEMLAGMPALHQLPPPDINDPKHDMDYLTNFERKFRKEGRPIHRALYEKRTA